MKNNIIKIIAIFILLISILGITMTNAGVVNLDSIEGVNEIKNNSIQSIKTNGDITDNIKDNGFKILTIIKTVVSGLLIIFIVYIGIQMVLSIGKDEDKLTTSKTQLRYTLMALIFINIPGTLYNMFVAKKTALDGTINGTWSSQNAVGNESVFINIDSFTQTINGGIVLFIKTAIFTIAIFMIILAGIKIMTAAGKEDEVKEAKNKILWSLIGLIFLGFIESWQTLVYNGKISDGATIFNTIENLILFFAGPVAIFFLSMAGYYYITSNGDEEKTKKAKNIIINVIIASVILMASHLFLKDLIALTI